MLKFRFLFIIPVIIAGCRPSTANHFPKTISAEVTNPLPESRRDVAVSVSVADMPMGASFVVRSNEVQLAAQRVGNSILVVLDSMKANEKRTITMYYNDSPTVPETQSQYRKRTQSELSYRVNGVFRNVNHLKVPAGHKPQSNFIRYEGSGWESEKVAYRLYLDQRNAIDVFGKKTSDMVLMGVGHDGSGSYHEMQPWGMDIMKVEESLGLGSIGMWNGDHVIRVDNTDSVVCEVGDDLLQSAVITKYYGWKTPLDTIDLVSEFSIRGGSRLTRHDVSVETRSLCTGIIKDMEARVFKSVGTEDSWGYIATYGKQSANHDNLGLVVLFPWDIFGGFHEDENNHVVEFSSADFGISYYFGAAWELEPNGIRNETDFIKWVEKSARELANPVLLHQNVK